MNAGPSRRPISRSSSERSALMFSTRIERIGVDPADSDELRLKKRLLVAIALMVSPAALLWGSVFLLSGEPIAALLPLLYAGFSSVSILLFALTRRMRFFL